MRNFLTVLALLLSGTGIFVSLAREELRCRVGLSSAACAPAIAQPDPNFSPGDRINMVRSPINPSGNEKSVKVGNSSPETAKVIETEQTPENILPSVESVSPETDKAEENVVAPVNNPLGNPSERKAVDTAAINNPAPKKDLPSGDPIAPPAAKNPAENNLIPVIPAEGVAIPVAPTEQE